MSEQYIECRECVSRDLAFAQSASPYANRPPVNCAVGQHGLCSEHIAARSAQQPADLAPDPRDVEIKQLWAEAFTLAAHIHRSQVLQFLPDRVQKAVRFFVGPPDPESPPAAALQASPERPAADPRCPKCGGNLISGRCVDADA